MSSVAELMPIPLSVTSNLITAVSVRSSSRYAWSATSPLPVNFTAFATKLVRTCRRRPGSPFSPVGTAACTSPVSSIPFVSARSANCASTCSTVVLRLNSRHSNSSFPASILLHSSTSLINCKRASPHWRMVSAYECCSGVNGVSISRLVMPITPFMGVRSSWLTVAKNADFTRADSVAFSSA